MMMRVLAATHDPGAANAVAAVVRVLRARGVEVIAIAKGPAEAQFRRAGVEFTAFAQGAIERTISAGIDLVLTGTSVVDAVDRAATRFAATWRVPTVALVDYWTNHDLRFSAADGVVLPDHVIAIDELCRRALIGDGMPPERIHVLGQPYFSLLLAERRPAMAPVPVRRLLFASQPGPIAADALAAVIRALGSIARPIELVVRFHPRETEREARLTQLAAAGCPFTVDTAVNPLDTACRVDAIIGISSMILIETSLLGVPTAGFQSDVPALAHYGLCEALSGDADVRAFLEGPGRVQPDEHFLEGQRQAADRVAAFCIDTAVSGVQRDPAMNRSLHG